MATVHNTSLVPSKLELLTAWLPRQPWYRGSGTPELARAGGFRLDDPAGEVGIEFLIVTDTAGPDVAGYCVPMTYRDAALDSADDALIGTSEHGVLGKRYLYDGPSDPVLRAELLALVRGAATAQAQTTSDAPDPAVHVGVAPEASEVDVVRVLTTSEGAPAPGEVSVPWRLPDGQQVRGVIALVRR